MAAGALNLEKAWNAVSLEERIELVSRVKAEAIVAAMAVALFGGAIAYGFNQVILLAVAGALALVSFPIYASYSWRQKKPSLVLRYLAIRSVARRWAFNLGYADYDIVLVFRGSVEIKKSEDDEKNEPQTVDLLYSNDPRQPAWICLMRGGLVVLTEQRGGAKAEFATSFGPGAACRLAQANDKLPSGSLIVTSAKRHNIGHAAIIQSKYPGAMYVLEKQMTLLLQERAENQQRLEEKRAAKDAKQSTR